MAGCDPCSVHQTVNKLATPGNNSHPSVAPFQSTSAVTNSSSNKVTTVASSQQQQSIWSTMKHLMRHGSHHHHPGPAANFAHAHVTTLSEASSISAATQLAPNVVDLTNNNTNASSKVTAESGVGGGKNQRPWSKSARIGRGATFHDIAPSLQPSAYHSSATTFTNTPTTTTTAAGSIANRQNHTTTGFKRLWRGVQTMFVGCIPAHALYFSSYEGIKSIYLDHNHKHDNNINCGNNNSANGGGNVESSQQHHVGIDTLSPLQAMVAGGVATLLHDFIMTPMDTMKQRMQLGHYTNLRDAFCSIVWGDRQQQLVGGGSSSSGVGGGAKNKFQEGVRMGGEGWKGLYRSFPITVMTNVPYGMIMMTTNEWLRAVLEDGIYGFHEHHYEDEKPFHFVTILLSGMGAGTVASAITAPLDRVKTRLQTQRMGMMIPSAVEGGVGGAAGGGGGGAVIMEERALAAAMGERKVCPKMAVQDVKSALFPSKMPSSSSSTVTSSIGVPSSSIPRPMPSLAQSSPFTKTYYTTPLEAFQSILQEEGPRGLFRGALPRVALHAPSVAISWTAYEMAKGWLLWLQ